MEKHLFIYLIAMIFLTIVAWVMGSFPDLAITIVWVTFGLGIPLVCAATFPPYMVALLPVVAALPSRRAALLALPVSAILALAWALGPNFVSNRQAETAAAALARADLDATAQYTGLPLPRSLEIRRPKDYDYRLRNGILPPQQCTYPCAELLMSGQVAWVRIVTVSYHRDRLGRAAREVTSSTFYKVAEGPDCAAPGVSGEVPAGRCVVFAQDDGEVAALVAELTEKLGISRIKVEKRALFSPIGERMLTLKRRDGDQEKPLLSQTEFHFRIVREGSFLTPGLGGVGQVGQLASFAIRGQVYNAIDMAMDLRRVGYDVPPRPEVQRRSVSQRCCEPPSDDDALAVISALDLPSDHKFSDEEARTIRNWVWGARSYKEWPAERIALLRRIVRDPRVTFDTRFGDVFARHEAVTKALLPDVLDLAAKMSPDGSDTARSAAIRMSKVDPAILKPYAERILGYVRQGGAAGQAMLGAVGRLGIDPSPYLLPLEAAKGDYDHARLHAACKSELRWGPVLIPHLRALVTERALAEKRVKIESVLRTLLRFGDRDFVMAAIDRSNWDKAGHLRRLLDSQFSKFGPSERLC